jgi:plasmid stabilization system protein ParE
MSGKFRVKITQAAKKDIEEIFTFIAEDSPQQAHRFLQALEKQVKNLESFPNRCPLIPENELLGSHYRHLFYGKYRSIFRISEKTIYVLRVIHGARLLDPTILEEKTPS